MCRAAAETSTQNASQRAAGDGSLGTNLMSRSTATRAAATQAAAIASPGASDEASTRIADTGAWSLSPQVVRTHTVMVAISGSLFSHEFGPHDTDYGQGEQFKTSDLTASGVFDGPAERNRHWPFLVCPRAQVRRVRTDLVSKPHKAPALGIKVGSEVHGRTLAKRKRFVYSVSRIYDFSVLLLNCSHEGH